MFTSAFKTATQLHQKSARMCAPIVSQSATRDPNVKIKTVGGVIFYSKFIPTAAVGAQ